MHAEDTYLFRHALLRDAAYNLQLPGDRAQLHSLALSIIERIIKTDDFSLPEDLLDIAHSDRREVDPYAHELSQHASAASTGADDAAMSNREAFYLWRAAIYLADNFELAAAATIWNRLAEHERLSEYQKLAAKLNSLRYGKELGYEGTLEGLQAILSRLPSADSSDFIVHRLRVRTLNSIGIEHRTGGRIDHAKSVTEKALHEAQLADDLQGIAVSLGNAAFIEDHLGQSDDAIEMVRRAVSAFRSASDLAGELHAMTVLGRLLSNVGNAGEARDLLQSVVDQAATLNRPSDQANALGALAALYSGLHEQSKSIPLFQEALSISRAIGNRIQQTSWTNSLGVDFAAIGNLEEAEKMFQASIHLARELGAKDREIDPLGGLASIYARTGRLQESLSLFEEALESAKVAGSTMSMMVLKANLSGLLWNLERHDDAIATMKDALELAQRTGDRRRQGLYQGSLCEYFTLMGMSTDADASWESCRQVLTSIEADSLLDALRGEINKARASCNLPSI